MDPCVDWFVVLLTLNVCVISFVAYKGMSHFEMLARVPTTLTALI